MVAPGGRGKRPSNYRLSMLLDSAKGIGSVNIAIALGGPNRRSRHRNLEEAKALLDELV
jgi:hypothetical protein